MRSIFREKGAFMQGSLCRGGVSVGGSCKLSLTRTVAGERIVNSFHPRGANFQRKGKTTENKTRNPFAKGVIYGRPTSRGARLGHKVRVSSKLVQVKMFNQKKQIVNWAPFHLDNLD